MDGSRLIDVIVPIGIPITLFTGIALHVIVGSRSGRGHATGRLAGAGALQRIGAIARKARLPKSCAYDFASVGYLYVPCIRLHGCSAGTHGCVHGVPIVKKTAKLIYYASDSWNPREAVISPGCISREQFETDTRGYPAGVIPVPGDCRLAQPAGLLFFATRQAAEHHLRRRERERTEQAALRAELVKELRRAMADAHPDRGGTVEQFIQARHRYQTALRGDSGGGKAIA